MDLEYYKEKYEEQLKIQQEANKLKYSKIKAAVLDIFPQAIHIKDDKFSIEGVELLGSEDGSLYVRPLKFINVPDYCKFDFKISFYSDGDLYPFLVDQKKNQEVKEKVGFWRKLKGTNPFRTLF